MIIRENLVLLDLYTFTVTITCLCSGKPGGKYPTDSTLKARTFVIRDFAVGTSTAIIANVTVDGTDVQVD